MKEIHSGLELESENEDRTFIFCMNCLSL